MNIHILTTGGTIDKTYFDATSEYAVDTSIIPDLLSDGRVQMQIEISEILRKDSLDMSELDRQAIRLAVVESDANKIVVTHGTDTLVDTAHILKGISSKTVVLTGALQPGRFKRSDAAFNLGMAIAAVQVLPPGVYVALNGLVLTADNVRKNKARNRFEVVSNPTSSDCCA